MPVEISKILKTKTFQFTRIKLQDKFPARVNRVFSARALLWQKMMNRTLHSKELNGKRQGRNKEREWDRHTQKKKKERKGDPKTVNNICPASKETSLMKKKRKQNFKKRVKYQHQSSSKTKTFFSLRLKLFDKKETIIGWAVFPLTVEERVEPAWFLSVAWSSS